MVGLLMLAAWLTAGKLNYDNLSFDEVRAYIVAGGAHHGPLTFPMGVWNRVAEQSPDQAMGFALLIWVWGFFVGWTELAARTLPYLVGLLTIAFTYRIGRDLFHPFVGISGAAMLASSIYFSTFMHKFRVFTIVAFAVSIAIWCYWRIALTTKRGLLLPSIGLVLSGIAMFYTHYYATPFIAVLGLYHLIFVPKNRRWWLPILLFIPVILAFLPELSVLSTGFSNNINNERVTDRALSPLEISALLAKYFSNDATWFFLILLSIALWALFQTLRRPQSPLRRNTIFLWWCAAVMLLMVFALNAVSQVFVISRVRYLIALWVPLALVLSLGLWLLQTWRPRVAYGVLAGWMLIGIIVTQQDELMWIGRGDQIRVHPWREMAAQVFNNGEPDDALIFQGKWFPQFGHYTHGIPIRWDIRPYDTETRMREATAANYKRIWYSVNLETPQAENLAIFQSILAEKDYISCGAYLDDVQLSLMLYVRSMAFCPGGKALYQFGDSITLMQVEQKHVNDSLVIYTGWALKPGIALDTYSIAFRLVDTETRNVLAQVDVGFGFADGPYTPIEALFDLPDQGNPYQLEVVVYNWQTGERLSGYGEEQPATTDFLPVDAR